jgi:hypothetical protein
MAPTAQILQPVLFRLDPEKFLGQEREPPSAPVTIARRPFRRLPATCRPVAHPGAPTSLPPSHSHPRRPHHASSPDAAAVFEARRGPPPTPCVAPRPRSLPLPARQPTPVDTTPPLTRDPERWSESRQRQWQRKQPPTHPRLLAHSETDTPFPNQNQRQRGAARPFPCRGFHSAAIATGHTAGLMTFPPPAHARMPLRRSKRVNECLRPHGTRGAPARPGARHMKRNRAESARLRASIGGVGGAPRARTRTTTQVPNRHQRALPPRTPSGGRRVAPGAESNGTRVLAPSGGAAAANPRPARTHRLTIRGDRVERDRTAPRHFAGWFNKKDRVELEKGEEEKEKGNRCRRARRGHTSRCVAHRIAVAIRCAGSSRQPAPSRAWPNRRPPPPSPVWCVIRLDHENNTTTRRLGTWCRASR